MVRRIDLPVVVEDLELRHCSANGCVLSTATDVVNRAIVRRVHATQLSVSGCLVSGVVFDDCTLNGLATNDLQILDACAFRHVTVRGRLGRVMVSHLPLSRAPQIADAFVAANHRFYESVDWALDISELEAKEFDLRGIPSRLIRRDPATQVVFRREHVAARSWESLDLHGTALRAFMDNLLHYGWPDAVFVTPVLDPRRDRILEALAKLREIGVAEPD
jgi:hypothetical protein